MSAFRDNLLDTFRDRLSVGFVGDISIALGCIGAMAGVVVDEVVADDDDNECCCGDDTDLDD
jgi:hypothetical protein